MYSLGLSILNATLGEEIQAWASSIVETTILVVKFVLARLFYGICSAIFLLLDMIQDLFKKFAGLETSGGTISTEGNDMVMTIIKSDILRNILISVLILGFILLFVFTIIAIIKMHYAAETKDTLAVIIGRSIRALFGFLLIPGLCLGGVYLSNVVLQAVDNATGSGSTITMSGRVFKSSCYEANYLRSAGISPARKLELANIYRNTLAEYGVAVPETRAVAVGSDEATEYIEEIAEAIDYGFANGFADASGRIIFDIEDVGKLPGMYWLTMGSGVVVGIGATLFSVGAPLKAFLTTQEIADFIIGTPASVTTTRNGEMLGKPYHSLNAVALFYNITQLNYVIMIATAVFMGWALCMITFGLIKRIFMLSYLYVISPALLAMYPLDNGQALGKWKGDFVGYTIMAYSSVAGLNIFMQVLPVVDKIKPYTTFNNYSANFLNSFVQLLASIVGLFTIKELINLIGGYIGGKNALDEGKQMSDQVKKTVGSVVEKGLMFSGGAAAAIKAGKFARDEAKGAGGAKSGFGKFFSNLGGTVKDIGGGVVGGLRAAGIKSPIGKARKMSKIEGYDAAGFKPATLQREYSTAKQDVQHGEQVKAQYEGNLSDSKFNFENTIGQIDQSKSESIAKFNDQYERAKAEYDQNIKKYNDTFLYGDEQRQMGKKEAREKLEKAEKIYKSQISSVESGVDSNQIRSYYDDYQKAKEQYFVDIDNSKSDDDIKKAKALLDNANKAFKDQVKSLRATDTKSATALNSLKDNYDKLKNTEVKLVKDTAKLEKLQKTYDELGIGKLYTD